MFRTSRLGSAGSEEEKKGRYTPPETFNLSSTQLQLNSIRNWVHKEKWWITAPDILKDHSSIRRKYLKNENRTMIGIGNRKSAGWETGWNSPISDHRTDRTVEEDQGKVSFKRLIFDEKWLEIRRKHQRVQQDSGGHHSTISTKNEEERERRARQTGG